MPRYLKDLKINEVSSVDKGAGRGVKVLLMKRDDDAKSNPSGEPKMTEQELQALIAKSVADAVAPITAANLVELAKRDHEIVLLKMSPTHKAFYDGCDEPTKKAFEAMDDKARDEHIKNNPVKKVDDAATIADLAKRDTVVAQLVADNATLTKRLDAVDLEKAQAAFVKRAADIGLTEPGDGELMRKAYAGDATAQAEFEKRQQAVAAAVKKQLETSTLFDEFGTRKALQGTAYQAIVAKGEELRKADTTLTKEQAFAKAYEDPDNAELVKQLKVEENRARMQVVA